MEHEKEIQAYTELSGIYNKVSDIMGNLGAGHKEYILLARLLDEIRSAAYEFQPYLQGTED